MNRVFRSWGIPLTIALAVSIGFLPPRMSKAQAPQQLASVEQLKAEAFKALRGGQFDRTNELIAQAASLSTDPQVALMAQWVKQFETQRQTFAADRRKAYDKAVANVMLLLKHNKLTYATDWSTLAYRLADDKKAFRNEKWVDDLIQKAAKAADESEKSEQWLKASRLYVDLSALEMAKPEWKDKLKQAARRVRILAFYVPDSFKTAQQSRTKDDEEVDALINPATQPTKAATKPATKPGVVDDDADAPKLDWHDLLRGVQTDMLWPVLDYAQQNYYRQVTYRQLMIGGISGLRSLVATRELTKAFPNLADAAKCEAFFKVLDEGIAAANAATDVNDAVVLRSFLAKLSTANRQTVDLPPQVWVSEFADGALSELDQFSTVIWPSATEEFNSTTQGEFSGVGIQIEQDPTHVLKVVSPLEDTPAHRAGIKPGDVITHIEGQRVQGMLLDQAVRRIKGPTGTTVTLTVRSLDGKVKDYTLRRETIKVASIKGLAAQARRRVGLYGRSRPEDRLCPPDQLHADHQRRSGQGPGTTQAERRPRADSRSAQRSRRAAQRGHGRGG